ncbi:MAG: (Na+)-NQR maturation NqrM [Porticoccaceae bacterium]|nr:(Na+)-NQR maturation NqrM [Porticoccaceae bacterium]HLS98173.1 (Na+)-NQR maturation NqrM [Porticoccaceae bacterium]
MIEFAIALVVMLLIVAAMAVGVMMGRSPLKGSCGGVGAALGEPNYSCEICGGDPAKCDAEAVDEKPAADKPAEGGPKTALGYDASGKRP